MQEIHTDDAPAPLGPYSQGIVDGDRVFVSGMSGLDPETGEVIEGTVADEAHQTLENAAAVLAAAEASLDDVVKTTVFLEEMADYEVVNEVYAEHMSEPYPARSAVEVGDLPGGVRVEIELIARKPVE